MGAKPELVAGLVAEPNAGTGPNRRTIYRRLAQSRLRMLRGCLAGLAAVGLVTLIGLRLHLNLSASGSLYFLIVVMISVVWGFWEASVTSLIAVSFLNYFFVPPIFTWTVSDPQNWVALATFEAAALTLSRLSTRAQDHARAEARQRAEVEKLYQLSWRILLLDRRQTIGPQMVSLIQEIFRTESAALFDATSARMDATGSQADDLDQLARSAYFRDGALEGADPYTWAHVLRLGLKPVGAIALRGPELRRLTIVPIASLAAIALERARSFDKESGAEAARQTEQLRTAVLDSLAHAFKTPLTAIWTASSGLLEGRRLSEDDAELATLIDEQADRLNRLASELLQMARIDAAEVRLRRERVSVLTLIDNVLARYREQLHGRRVVAALDAGADDYITKPFNIRELAARIRAAVRRSSAFKVDPDGVIRIGNIELDPARRLVRKAGELIHVTPKEFDLLHYLMAHAGLPITHARLLHAVWGPEYGGELEYLRTFVRQLRKKLEDDPGEPAYLLTDSHIGYRFAEGKPEPVEEQA